MVVSSLNLLNSEYMNNKNSQIKPECVSAQLAHRLRNLRRDKGLSQEKVAYAAGLSAYTYQKYEKGESKPGTPLNPCLHTLVALANVFEISLQELLDFDDNVND